MTNIRNEISNFQKKFDESFYEAWDRYKDLLYAYPHHGFTELHQLDTFYNALNPSDQDSLNSAAGGNLLERSTQDVLTIIENKSKVRNSRNKSVISQVKSSDGNSSSSNIAKLTHVVNQQTSAVTTAMMAIVKQFQATLPPAFVKAVEEICVTCGSLHPYYQCLAANGNTFLEYQDNIQGYVAAAATLIQQNQSVPLNELENFKKTNEANMKAMQAQINNVKNELRNEMESLIQASMLNQTNKLKNMMASFFQMNTASTSGTGSLPSNTVANLKSELKAITTRSGLVLDGPTVLMPPPFINPKEDERVEETLTDLEHDTSINDSQKIDSLLDEFTEFNSENSTESFSPFSNPIEEVDSFMEDIDIFLDGDDSMPPDIPVDVPHHFCRTHPALQLDFDFIPSNDLGSDLNVSSPFGDSNKIYDPGI
ncbi:hypothetical protein Tco_1181866 [Tanacetum coccineum]